MSQPSHMSELHQGLLQPAAAAMFNPSFQVGLSDHNIMKIAMQTKQLLSQEIDKLVEEKVKVKTAELCKSVESLQSDNLNLKDNISKLEVKLTTKMGDLEQYSRRSCVRIAGIPENTNENTNEHVLDLAERLNIDISPRATVWGFYQLRPPRSPMMPSPHDQGRLSSSLRVSGASSSSTS